MTRPGRPRGSRDPHLSPEETRALLLTRGATPADIARALGVHRQAIDRALRVGLTFRLVRRWGLME